MLPPGPSVLQLMLLPVWYMPHAVHCPVLHLLPGMACRVRAMRAGIEASDSCWWVQRLFNMATITREWVALQHAHLMPFR